MGLTENNRNGGSIEEIPVGSLVTSIPSRVSVILKNDDGKTRP